MASAQETAQPSVSASEQLERTLICTIVTADTVDGALEEIKQAAQEQAHVIELRADYLTTFDPERDIERMLDACSDVGLPAIFTCRPAWEGYPLHFLCVLSCCGTQVVRAARRYLMFGRPLLLLLVRSGKFDGSEAERLTALKYAALLGAAYVDVELKAAALYFGGAALLLTAMIGTGSSSPMHVERRCLQSCTPIGYAHLQAPCNSLKPRMAHRAPVLCSISAYLYVRTEVNRSLMATCMPSYNELRKSASLMHPTEPKGGTGELYTMQSCSVGTST